MAYIAKRQLRISPDDVREIGEPVPEAAGWKNLATYLRLNWIVEVDGDAEVSPSTTGPVVEEEATDDALASLTVAALRAKAKTLGLTGLSKTNKAGLVAAIESAV